MMWLARLKTFLGLDRFSRLYKPDKGCDDAKNVLEEARAALEEAQAQSQELRELRELLTSRRNRNHFGESFQIAMMPREKRI